VNHGAQGTECRTFPWVTSCPPQAHLGKGDGKETDAQQFKKKTWLLYEL